MSLDESIVLYRLSDYERRGWISQIDSAQYRSVMNQRRGDAVTLRQISHRLDELALNGGTRITEANNKQPKKKEQQQQDDDSNNNMASPTATSSSSATSASSYSGATTNSMASTADDDGDEEEEEVDQDDDHEEVHENKIKKKVEQIVDATKAKKDKPSTAAAAAAASALSAPYLRSLQCISNLAAEAHSAAGTSIMMQGGTRGDKPPAITASASHSKQHHHVTWKDDNANGGGGSLKKKDEPGGNAAGEDAFHHVGPRIVEPNQLWNESNSALNPALLQELFVEMCFYARLGFVQPPCCLKCTYRHAHNDKKSTSSNDDDNNNDRCQQFVVWRKDATALLHPGTLATNIVLVPCQSAQQLLDGQVVSEHYWDAAQKKLRTVVKSVPASASTSTTPAPKLGKAPATRKSHKA